MFLGHPVESSSQSGEINLEESGEGPVGEVDGFIVSVAEVLDGGCFSSLLHQELILLHKQIPGIRIDCLIVRHYRGDKHRY